MKSGRKENQRKAGMEYYTEKYFEEEQKNRGPCQMAAGILCSREYFTGLPLAF